MKSIKLPITDQFLLDVIYPFVSASDDIINFLTSDKYQRIDIMFGNENPVINHYRKSKNRAQFDRALQYLKRNNYIYIKDLQGKKALMLTKKGISKALKASFKSKNKQKRLDGKWIMIAFDVPQKYHKARNLLRSVLKNLGYKIFQQSVWVTPYDVSEKTETLLQYYTLDKYVKIFLIEEL